MLGGPHHGDLRTTQEVLGHPQTSEHGHSTTWSKFLVERVLRGERLGII